MLTSFTLEQLQFQLAGLQALVKDSASHLEQVRMLERQQRALRKQRQYDAKRKACMLHQKAPNAANSPTDHADTEKGATGDDSVTISNDCNSVCAEDVISASAGASAKQTAEELSIGAQLGKTRRRTLRKQIERLQARIAVLTASASAPAASFSVSTNSANQLQGESTAVLTAELTASTAAPDAATSVTDGEVQYNPKTRGGWGFWKT